MQSVNNDLYKLYLYAHKDGKRDIDTCYQAFLYAVSRERPLTYKLLPQTAPKELSAYLWQHDRILRRKDGTIAPPCSTWHDGFIGDFMTMYLVNNFDLDEYTLSLYREVFFGNMVMSK